MSALELRICPGIEKLYRLALIDGDAFTVLSEHDTADEAVDAKRAAQAAADQATAQLERVVA